jgi:hypothetical protein
MWRMFVVVCGKLELSAIGEPWFADGRTIGEEVLPLDFLRPKRSIAD